MKFIYNKLNFYVACLECLCVHGIFSLWLNLYVSWNVQSIHNRCPHLEHYDFIYMHVMHVYTKSQIRYLQYANMLAEHWLILTIEKLAMHNQHLLFNNEPSYVGTTFNELQLDILTWLTFLFLFFPSFVLTNCKVQLNPMLIPAIIGGLRGGWGLGESPSQQAMWWAQGTHKKLICGLVDFVCYRGACEMSPMEIYLDQIISLCAYFAWGN